MKATFYNLYLYIMKKLELNQMESYSGGLSAKCKADMGISALVGGLFGGPWGYALGAACAYLGSPEC